MWYDNLRLFKSFLYIHLRYPKFANNPWIHAKDTNPLPFRSLCALDALDALDHDECTVLTYTTCSLKYVEIFDDSKSF